MMYGFPGAGGWGGPYGLWMMFAGSIFWILVILAAIWAAFQLFRRGSFGSGRDEALQILRNRYARGEIDEEEFRERSDKLRQ